MKSPRFDVRARSLKRIFSPDNIQRIWQDKVRVSMRQQFVADGIEHFDFHISREIECRKLSQLILSGDYVPSRPQRILVEKSKGLCRQLVIPTVPDAVVLQCLSDALYRQIWDKAPTTRSFFEPRDHRFSSTRSEYGTFAAWLNFQKGLFEFSKERAYIVVTDIANYYDSISYVHLRNVISGTVEVEESVLDMLIYVLSDLLWQPDYSPRVEIGLPQMNLDAPRLLAHCFLYELDKCLDLGGHKDFVRYMDDIDVGVDSVVAARKVLQDVDLILQTRQVRLNSGKTQILTKAEAATHFRIAENVALNRLSERLEARAKQKRSLRAIRKRIENEIRSGLRGKKFDGGNGDKVLKRWISLAIRASANISDKNLVRIILYRPSVRENALDFIMRAPLTPGRARLLADCAESGHLVDDAGMVDLCNNLVETKVTQRRARHPHILRVIAASKPDTYFGLYCRLWLQSKYEVSSNLLRTIQLSQRQWAPHERLGRLVGSFLPLFEEAEYSDYYNLVRRSGNQGALAVIRFHKKLRRDKQAFNRMFEPLRNPNPSKGTGITHAKFLCLLSALNNDEATPRQRQILKEGNVLVFSDVYYSRILGART